MNIPSKIISPKNNKQVKAITFNVFLKPNSQKHNTRKNKNQHFVHFQYSQGFSKI